MKIRCVIALFLCVVSVLGLLVVPVTAAEETEENIMSTNGCYGIEASNAYMGTGRLTDSVKSVFMYEINSDTLLYSWNCDTQVHPASFVKLMTALLVLENCDLQENTTVSKSALHDIGNQDVSINLQVGEQMSIENLMYALMVHAANDAANVLAEHAAGSIEAFVEMMNARAQELGCTGTVFYNPHGLHHADQYMTARDTCRILLAALEHETFRTMFCTDFYIVPPTNLSDERRLVTNNYLINADYVAIYLDHRVKGGRTGVASDNRRNIASLSESNDMEVLCIVMGADSVYASNGYSVGVYGGFPQTISLLDQVYHNTARRQVICADQILKQQPVNNGDNHVFCYSKETCSAVLPADYTLDQLDFRYTQVPGSVDAPITKGQNLAKLQVWYQGNCIAQTDVYAANDVPLAYVKSGEMANGGRAGRIVFIVLLILVLPVVAAFGVLLLLRVTAQRKHRNRVRRRRG